MRTNFSTFRGLLFGLIASLPDRSSNPESDFPQHDPVRRKQTWPFSVFLSVARIGAA